MPQLDLFTFSTQLFWFIFIFLFFYFLLLNNFLIQIFKIIRLREFINNFFSNSYNFLYREKYMALYFNSMVLKYKLNFNKKYLNELILLFFNWFNLRKNKL